ncbi:MAG: hypothetical protein O2980_00910, partial [Actinomycetota bacterium]|nr:hypothetical protein [Actinomycetota bacterium]
RDPRRTRLTGIPGPLQPLVGGLVLVASVRLVDALWCRSTGRPAPSPALSPPLSPGPDTDAPVTGSAAEAREVRDRVVHAFLLGAAMRVARWSGLPRDDTGR